MLRCIKEAGKDSQGSFSYIKIVDISAVYKRCWHQCRVWISSFSGDCVNRYIFIEGLILITLFLLDSFCINDIKVVCLSYFWAREIIPYQCLRKLTLIIIIIREPIHLANKMSIFSLNFLRPFKTPDFCLLNSNSNTFALSCSSNGKDWRRNHQNHHIRRNGYCYSL